MWGADGMNKSSCLEIGQQGPRGSGGLASVCSTLGKDKGSACEENLTARNGISPTLRKACFLLMWLIDCSLFLIVPNTSSWIWPLWSKATLLREFKFIPALW